MLLTGTVLGPYRIVGKLGEGGMGEVFRAHDTRLNRDVAIKVLPELFASDPDRLARFTREAQTLAALNHPNIAHLHGLEEGTPGVRALVMELVEGEDLAAHIARGPMPLADVVPIARQIADALEAAHEQGIVHRDLKPANVKVRPDGTVKVLDFGLAKALAPPGSPEDAVAQGVSAGQSPTRTAPTQMGMIIGTAAYMAPELARGRAVDKRADIWAFGVVLYEMLTGARAFDGDDMSELLATVLKSEPNWQALPAATPPSIRRLLRRCLEKDPRRRLSAIADARLELEEIAVDAGADAAPAARAGRRIALPLAVGMMVVAIAATAAAMRWLVRPTIPVGGGPTRVSIALPDGDEIAEPNLLPLAISPDGATIAYAALRGGVRYLFVRNLADAGPTLIAGSEGARAPFFSPDRQWIAFFAQGKLKKMAIGSRALFDITSNISDARGGAWGADGTIYFAPRNIGGLWKVPASGGSAMEATSLDLGRGEISHRWPEALPGGGLLFASWSGPGPDEHILVTQNTATGRRHDLTSTGDTPRFIPAGYLAYGRLDALFALRWQPSQTSLQNAVPISLPETPRMENEGALDYAVSSNGTLVYLAGGPDRYTQRIVWVDRDGTTEPLPIPDRDFESVGLSPDGQRAVVQVRDGAMGLWMYDFARHTLTPFQTAGGSSQAPLWTADGRRVFYRGTRNGTRNIYWKAADGSGSEQRLTTKADVIQTPSSVSPDGRWFVFNESGGAPATPSVWVVDLQRAGATPEPRGLPIAGNNGQISPDGRWIAYQTAGSGKSEVFITSFPQPGAHVPVSVTGGDSPRWSRDGRELFFTTLDKTMTVTIAASGAAPSVSAPHVLYQGRFRGNVNALTPYDVSAGGRFLRIQQVQPERGITRIEVVLNWVNQLKPSAAK